MSIPGVGQLFDELDKKIMVYLRDGRILIGILRSLDQFGNLVLHRTIERIHVGKQFGDVDRGIIIIRGDNIVLLGEVDEEKESKTELVRVSFEEILEHQRMEQEKKHEQEELRAKFMKERGIQYVPEINSDELY